jgi:nitrogen fixation/metabolism regulation signal transduction histidine kinase
MGIGLSIVEQVAKDHGGYFTIQNNTKSPGATAILSIARHH